MADDVVVIEPSRGWQPLQLGRLWQFRELGYFFVWRELKVRYKQTFFGAAWAVLQPALMTVIFALIFGRLARLSSDGLPYALFAFAALVPWTFFSMGVSQGVRSLVASSALISRVYFPRLLLPTASVLSFLLDLVVASAILVPVMALYGEVPGASLVFLPLFVVLLVTATSGTAYLLAAAGARYRDVQFVVPFLVQLWLFATPVVYSLSLIPEAWRPLYALNPMVAVIEGFRFSFLGSAAPSPTVLAVSSASAVVLLVVGASAFRQVERRLADVL